MPETMLLRDPDVVPTEEVLESTLGKKIFTIYKELERLITNDELSLTYSWNYYKDGKSWLCKVVNGKKTIFWLSAWDGYIKTSFFFTEKIQSGVFDLEIDKNIKQEFKQSKATGKLIPLILDIIEKSQLKDLKEIIKYKKSLK